MPEGDVLGVFTKSPRPGLAKTRLARDTSPEWAARAAEALLLDTLDLASAVAAERRLAFDPPSAGEEFHRLAPGWDCSPQAGGDLGPRMEEFFRSRFAAGARRVVLIGTDSPHMPAEFLARAFDSLSAADAVIGPAADGGYYLLGLSRLLPIFTDIPWGGSSVLLRTAERLTRAGGSLTLLPLWGDVDTLDDWVALLGHLAVARLSGADVKAARCFALGHPAASSTL